MSVIGEANHIKMKNVIDMAVTFTAMVRVFEKGSKPEISKRLELDLSKFSAASNRKKYEVLHASFCQWFVKNIRTAEKRRNGKIVKNGAPASYGHAAKVFDIAAKVYVHYCHLPDVETAIKLLPLIHGAIDNPILNGLKDRYPSEKLSADSIESIGEDEYAALQLLVAKHISEEFNNEIYPAQYDDIMWHRLNRQV